MKNVTIITRDGQGKDATIIDQIQVEKPETIQEVIDNFNPAWIVQAVGAQINLDLQPELRHKGQAAARAYYNTKIRKLDPVTQLILALEGAGLTPDEAKVQAIAILETRKQK